MGILIAFLMFAVLANNTPAKADAKFFDVSKDGGVSKEITKVDAMKKLLATDNKANIYKCNDVELDQRRGTIRNK
jgi:hypothetical protein